MEKRPHAGDVFTVKTEPRKTNKYYTGIGSAHSEIGRGSFAIICPDERTLQGFLQNGIPPTAFNRDKFQEMIFTNKSEVIPTTIEVVK